VGKERTRSSVSVRMARYNVERRGRTPVSLHGWRTIVERREHGRGATRMSSGGERKSMEGFGCRGSVEAVRRGPKSRARM
jgi:hypothetical protein